MAKYYGAIGFSAEVETAPDVWTPGIVERNYSGDIVRVYPKWQNGQKVNDDVSVNHRVSVIADAYALSHLGMIRYVVWHGIRWKVNGFEVQHPRILLDIGTLYNGGDVTDE